MSNTVLNISMLETYKKETLGILDGSFYAILPSGGNVEITPPNFPAVSLAFSPNSFNIYSSFDLGITTEDSLGPIPDGIYHVKYTVTSEPTLVDEISFLRVNKLQEKFDDAFMSMDLMECDVNVKKASQVALDTIYFLIEGAKAAANTCANTQATRLYKKADVKLDRFIEGLYGS